MKALAGKIMLARLFEKTSGAGNRYFSGRLGAARCVLFAAGINPESGDPEWHLFLQDGSDPPPPSAANPLTPATKPKAARRAPVATPGRTRRKKLEPAVAAAARAWTLPEWTPPK